MVKSASFVDIKLPIPGGASVQAGQALSRNVRVVIQMMRRNTGLQPEVCLLEMPEAHFHTEALAMHRHQPPPWSKACSSRGRGPPR